MSYDAVYSHGILFFALTLHRFLITANSALSTTEYFRERRYLSCALKEGALTIKWTFKGGKRIDGESDEKIWDIRYVE